MSDSDPLLSPFQLKHLRLRNRLMSTSHEPNYSENGIPGVRYRLYHAEKARGGIALTMTAGSAVVSRDSPAAFGNLHAYRDEIVAPLGALAEACHEHGAAVMIQLTHLGWRTQWNHSDWLPVLSPSARREPAHRAFPKVMEDWDIARIVSDYADAAARMQAAGLDGIEFEAYGHLMDAFWSPGINDRCDAYGGSLDNRMRFSLEVIDAVRAQVGPDFIVGIRMVCDEDWDRGLSREEGVEIARRLVASGQIDFLNVIRGRVSSDALMSKVIPIQGMPASPSVDFAGAVRASTGFPVFHAARVSDVAAARHAIAEGKLDMVGMTRPHIADPHIVNKLKAGQPHRIRPCVGATYCLDRIYEGHEALCIHNAASGREASMPHVVARAGAAPRRVLVVGGGPAGLEAARVCAERGHEVTLMEAASEAGGQVRLAARLPRRRELIGIIDWRVSECELLGVRLLFNRLVEARDVRAERPHVVLIATGGLPQSPPLDEGSDLVVSSWDILSGDVAPGDNVLVFDDNGQHPGMMAAEAVARAGARLELVTPERFFAPDIGGLNHVPYAEAFHQHDVTITINTRLRAVRSDGNSLTAVLASDYARSDIATRRIDQVVVEHGTQPLDALYFELKPESINGGEVDYAALLAGRAQNVHRNPDGAFLLFRIGDAVASRNIHAAVYDALRLCKDL